jgi:hypothetical protein
MYALVLFIQFGTTELPPNQLHQVSYEVVSHHATDAECMKAKAEIKKNDTVQGKHAYECIKIDKE